MVRRTLWCAVLVLAGCAPGNTGLVLAGPLEPDDECVYDSSSAFLTGGVLDVAPGRVSYTVTALAFNQLINLGSSGATAPPMADPNVITVQEAQVELRDVQGNPLALAGLPNPFTVPATGFIPSSDGTDPGTGLTTIEVIPPLYGEALRGAAGSRIIAVVRALGVTAGDADVLSPELLWPIELCAGCLFACQRAGEDGPVCLPSCRPGQDELTITPGACLDPPILGGCIPGM